MTLSIDSADARVGRPLTPVSVAGVHRRAYRRAAYGTAVAYGGYAAYGSGYYNTVSPGYGYGGLSARLSGRPPGGDPSRPLALRREPKLSGLRASPFGALAEPWAARVSDIFGSQHRRPVRGTVKVHHWKGATHEEDHCPGDTGLCGCRWRCDHGSPTLGYDGVRQPQLLSNYADRPFLGALLH